MSCITGLASSVKNYVKSYYPPQPFVYRGQFSAFRYVLHSRDQSREAVHHLQHMLYHDRQVESHLIQEFHLTDYTYIIEATIRYVFDENVLVSSHYALSLGYGQADAHMYTISSQPWLIERLLGGGPIHPFARLLDTVRSTRAIKLYRGDRVMSEAGGFDFSIQVDDFTPPSAVSIDDALRVIEGFEVLKSERFIIDGILRGHIMDRADYVEYLPPFDRCLLS